MHLNSQCNLHPVEHLWNNWELIGDLLEFSSLVPPHYHNITFRFSAHSPCQRPRCDEGRCRRGLQMVL
ncbi:hypothetical protein ANCCAN_24854 [Ancylostoma caninum]|uniref:Uncharacterized protein n=1 Tax=Ancylostoma caninum TaxID=29170 RepID=A0A368FCQ0_ANCCA|nr:hypothetical protein ANCCAN_24854 [Ancylostoma caninum]